MRRLSAIVAAAFVSPAFAQTPPVSAIPSPNTGNPFQMPGVAVGQPLLKPVGTQLPRAGSSAAPSVGSAPSTMSLTDPTSQLPGQKINPANVVAPLPDNMSGPTDPTLWDKFVMKFGASLGLTSPQPRAPSWTPGISRRNRERTQERMQAWWRRD